MRLNCIARFTDPIFLKRIGRPLLAEFLRRFEPDLAGRCVLLPPSRAQDHEFFNLMAHLLMTPEGLPDAMHEALHAISEMAAPEGQQRIEQVIREAGKTISFREESSREDMAMQLWLDDPALLARARNLHRFSRLSTFHHFACPAGVGNNALAREDLGRIGDLQRRCEQWFASHLRGRQNTRIEMYELPPPEAPSGHLETEYWFLIRHGDTFVRTPKIDHGRTEVLHFRPARDDVVVFSPSRSELRVNARTMGERDLYRAAFGEHIFGAATAFSERKRYTLAPLLHDGRGALDTHSVQGLTRVILRGVEAALPGSGAPRIIIKAADVFDALRDNGLAEWRPEGAELTQAWFDLCVEGTRAPRPVQLRPPNTLRLSRNVSANIVESWFAAQGFRISSREKAEAVSHSAQPACKPVAQPQ